MVDEKLRQRRALEIVGASGAIPVIDDRSTNDGVKVVVGTAEGDSSVDLVGSEKLDPPTYW